MTAYVWFRLVDKNGEPFKDSEFSKVPLQKDVDDFRKAVKGEYSNLLKNVDPGQLKVYANKADAIRAANKLKSSDSVDGHDHEDSALFVAVQVKADSISGGLILNINCNTSNCRIHNNTEVTEE